MSFEITDASRDMLPGIASIELECFSDPWNVNMLAETADDAVMHIYAIVNNDENNAGSLSNMAINENRQMTEIVGFGIVSIVCDEAQIIDIAISKKYRRQGLGARLLRHMLRYAVVNGADRAFLEVRRTNLEAIGLYEKFGFIAISVRKNYYVKPPEDAIVMKKELSQKC